MYKRMVAWVAVVSLASAFQALANPTGPAVVSGAATFTTNGNTLTVVNSDKAIINWQGFSIGAGETTRFNQPSASAVVLNRVISASPSSIFGMLTSNGNVFLVNPNGILFGAGSPVSVGGLTLSTSDIADANFLAGNNTFSGGGSASISIAGSIVAPAGIFVNSGGTTTVTGTLATSGTVNIPGQVVVGGGGAVITGGTITVGGTTLTGAVILTQSGGSIGLSPGKLVAIGRAAPAGTGNQTQQGAALAPPGPATVMLNLEKREFGF